METDSEKLLRDLRVVVQDAEDLIRATSADMGDRTRQARAKLASALVVARERCNQMERKAWDGAYAAGQVIRSYPVPLFAAAFALGFFGGYLLRKGRG